MGVHRTAEEALVGVPKLQPEVVLIEVKLPGINGIECLRRLRRIRPRPLAQVVMLSACEDDELVFEALKAGASGYVLKGQIVWRELPLAIKEVANGGAVMSPSITRKVIRHFQAPLPDALVLSTREMEVLGSLSEGLMDKEVAARPSISLNTVRRHVGAIYGKLEVHSRAQAARHYSRWRGQ